MPEIVSNPPNPSNLMKSTQAMGNYALSSALADLIDNSINAGASEINIEFILDSSSPVVVVSDNGKGMDQTQLREAMRLASSDPDNERSDADLGRFGMGLKSASLSQSSSMKVFTRSEGGMLSGAGWDLDLVSNSKKDWAMYLYDESEIISIYNEFGLPIPNKSFTSVIWDKCDRLVAQNTENSSQLNAAIVKTSENLSLIFHRFLSAKSRPLAININGRAIEPIDPFLTHLTATQPHTPSEIELNKVGSIEVQAFTLPHYSKLSKNDQDLIDRDEGINRNQGFYVYRNKRLIIHGTWFGVFKQNELSNLARVRLDIKASADMDKYWHLAVNKAGAQLPAALKRQLKEKLEHLPKNARRVYTNRGRIRRGESADPFWVRSIKHSVVTYRINEENKLIQLALDQLRSGNYSSAELLALLGLISKAVPIGLMRNDIESENEPIADDKYANETLSLLGSLMPSLWEAKNGNEKAIVRALLEIDFFSDKGKLVEQAVKDYESGNSTGY